MTRPPTSKDPLLEQITASILSRVQPKRIILFGSRARGDARPDSDYDLAVEVETELRPKECRELLYGAMPREQRSHVDIIVVKPGRLDQSDDPGLVFHDIAREGTVIYPVGGGRLAPPPRRVREGNAPPPSVATWVGFAETDARGINALLATAEIEWPLVCFHAQQAAEKYLKALLVQRWVKPERTHKLTDLFAAVVRAGHALPDLARACAVLEPYAVDVRYPGDDGVPLVEPGEIEGRLAVEAFRLIADAAKAVLRPA